MQTNTVALLNSKTWKKIGNKVITRINALEIWLKFNLLSLNIVKKHVFYYYSKIQALKMI